MICDKPAAGQPAEQCQALMDFLQEHRARLVGFVERRLSEALRRKVDPEDIVQETWAEALRQLPARVEEPGELYARICQIAEHRIIDAHRFYFGAQKRNAGRERSLDSPVKGSSGGGLVNLLIASLTTPSEAFSRNVREQQLLAALARLPEPQRDALRLRYHHGLPTKQIAAQLGKSDAAVRVMLTRALQRLEALLSE